MQTMLLGVFNEWAATMGVGIGLIVALAVITIAIGAAGIAFAVLRAIIAWNYWIARKPVTSATTGEQAALSALRLMGVTDVKVVKAGFFRALLYNNHYNPAKKTVYLRKTTFKGRNVTSIALAAQKAALVLQDRENSAKFRARWRMQRCAVFGPLFFIPLVLIGLVIDFALSSGGAAFSGVATLAMTAVGLVFFILAAVLAGLTIPVEKRAAKDAIQLLTATNLFLPEELGKAERVLKTYILAYITDFIITILKIIQFLLKLFLQIFAIFGKNRK